MCLANVRSHTPHVAPIADTLGHLSRTSLYSYNCNAPDAFASVLARSEALRPRQDWERTRHGFEAGGRTFKLIKQGFSMEMNNAAKSRRLVCTKFEIVELRSRT